MNRFQDILVKTYSWSCGIILLTAVSGIIGYLFIKGAGVVDLRLIFGDIHPADAILLRRQVLDGLFPAMAGTFFLVLFSVSVAVPLGLAGGVYMSEYAGGKVKWLFSFFFDILAGIPSIVIGLFGFSIAVFLHRHFSDRVFPCFLISGLSLSFLVLPYIIRTTQLSLESLPALTRNTAPALGATRLQNIRYVLIPQSLPGILSGVILAVGRCAEDTAVIMLTGAVAMAGVPRSLLSNYEALPFYIFYISSQYANPRELSTGYGAAIILLGVCTVLFLLAFIVQKGVSRQAMNGV